MPTATAVAEKVEMLFKFKGGMGEHGPHAPVLGPDGLIYIMIGNHAFVEPAVAADQPASPLLRRRAAHAQV